MPLLIPKSSSRPPIVYRQLPRWRQRLRKALRTTCWIAIVTGLALGLYLTLRQNSNFKDLWWMPRWVDGYGWLRNVPAFALLAVPCLIVANGRRARRKAIVALATFVAVTEAAQYFIPGRWCEWQDVACGWAGLLIMWALFETFFWTSWKVRAVFVARKAVPPEKKRPHDPMLTPPAKATLPP